MTRAAFAIAIDHDRRLVALRFSGFWDASDFASFRETFNHQSARVPWRGGHLAMVDLSECAIQSRDVFAGLRDMIEREPRKPRRFALVGGEGLARLQFRRMVVRDDIRLFDTRVAAEQWLFASKTNEGEVAPQVTA